MFIQKYLVLQKKKGFKVILSGTGADEIFTGYYDHYLMHLYHCKNNKKKFEKKILSLEKRYQN